VSFIEFNLDAISRFEAGMTEVLAFEPDAWGIFVIAEPRGRDARKDCHG